MVLVKLFLLEKMIKGERISFVVVYPVLRLASVGRFRSTHLDPYK